MPINGHQNLQEREKRAAERLQDERAVDRDHGADGPRSRQPLSRGQQFRLIDLIQWKAHHYAWEVAMNRIALALALILAGCSPTISSLTTEAVFDPAEAEFILQDGNNTVSGQALVQRRNGTITYASESEVALIPVTAYSSDRMNKVYGTQNFSGELILFDDTPREYHRLSRSAIADRQGNFIFSNVPDGDYYLTTSVVWSNGEIRKGGTIMQRVQVAGNQALEVALRGVE